MYGAAMPAAKVSPKCECGKPAVVLAGAGTVPLCLRDFRWFIAGFREALRASMPGRGGRGTSCCI